MKKNYFLFFLFCLCSVLMPQNRENNTHLVTLPIFKTENGGGNFASKIEKAYRIAIGDIMTNVNMYKSGVLKESQYCILAGLEYNEPWTRDASINTWNGAGLFIPEISKNTLLSQIEFTGGKYRIIGQYWDNIIWAAGAWNYYLYTGDREFLKIAYDAVYNSIIEKENSEFDKNYNLFRGGAVYGDGVAAYPDIYTTAEKSENDGTYSGIMDWIDNNPTRKVQTGHGLPMFALSTNCIYFEAYNILTEMEKELGVKSNDWQARAERLKKSINENFWNASKKSFNYLIDPYGGSDRQEGLGLSFALLFDIADSSRSEQILNNTYSSPAGIPCVYPSFERYVNKEKTSVGRHSGSVWPHVQGFWAHSAAKFNRENLFMHEFEHLTSNAIRDNQFVEIYHPETGLSYGGIQEADLKNWHLWKSCDRQTWSATGYIRMVTMGLFGLSFNTDGIRFKPVVPFENKIITLENILYRNAVLNISVKGKGHNIKTFYLNGKKKDMAFLPSSAEGMQYIEIELMN